MLPMGPSHHDSPENEKRTRDRESRDNEARAPQGPHAHGGRKQPARLYVHRCVPGDVNTSKKRSIGRRR